MHALVGEPRRAPEAAPGGASVDALGGRSPRPARAGRPRRAPRSCRPGRGRACPPEARGATRPTGVRNWRTRSSSSPSSGRMQTAPGCSTISRVCATPVGVVDGVDAEGEVATPWWMTRCPVVRSKRSRSSTSQHRTVPCAAGRGGAVRPIGRAAGWCAARTPRPSTTRPWRWHAGPGRIHSSGGCIPTEPRASPPPPEGRRPE